MQDKSLNISLLKVILFLIVIIAEFNAASAQNHSPQLKDSIGFMLRGIVLDSATHQPVSNVNVYLANTTIGTTTDNAGYYELKFDNYMNTYLVFSHVAYRRVQINLLGKKVSQIIMLSPQLEFDEVEITINDPYSRQEKLQLFRDYLLGTNKSGKSCKIHNEDSIKIWFLPSTMTLRASCKSPLVIENRYFGYDIRFYLDNFQIKLKHSTKKSAFTPLAKRIASMDVEWSQFYGSAFFIDKKCNIKTFTNRRAKMYEQSCQYFLYCLANGILPKSNFALYLDSAKISSDELCVIQDTILNMKKIIIRKEQLSKPSEKDSILGKILVLRSISAMPSQLIPSKQIIKRDFYMSIPSNYDKNNISEILFLSDTLVLNRFGTIAIPPTIRVGGAF